jgi:hypothetical protein
MAVKRLFVHLAATIALAVGLTILIEQRGASRDLEFIIPLAILVFIAHALWLAYQVAQRVLGEQEAKEKPKRSERLADDDDGEVVAMMFDAEPPAKRKHGE